MTYSLGVDLGATFVAAAVTRPTGVEMVPLGDYDVLTPAVVHIAADGRVRTGDAAARRAVRQPELVGRNVKHRLGDPTPIVLSDVAHPAPTLLGAQLRDVLQRVTDAEGGPPERIVLTHPAHWGPAQREVFTQVPLTAGVVAPRMVTEPEAAVHHATSGRLGEGEIVLVYDLGGGTFEATVVREQAGGLEILGTPERLEDVGGAAFDEAILSYVHDVAGGGPADLDPGDARAVVASARLRQDCVLAKEALSLDTETVIPVFVPGRPTAVPLTRAAFEEMVRVPVGSTVEAVSRTLRSAGLTPSDLSSVLLVGGSSRIPLVADMVSQELGCRILRVAHPEYAVALGAAALAGPAAEPRADPSAAVDGEPTVPGATSPTTTPRSGPARRSAPVRDLRWRIPTEHLPLAAAVALAVLVLVLVYLLVPGAVT